jgi:hypothetical protein
MTVMIGSRKEEKITTLYDSFELKKAQCPVRIENVSAKRLQFNLGFEPVLNAQICIVRLLELQPGPK